MHLDNAWKPPRTWPKPCANLTQSDILLTITADAASGCECN